MVTLTVTGTTLSETIDNFNNVTNCQGTPDSTISFNATVALGEVGASTSVSAATDVDLTPDVDLFSCGAGQPAYTLIKFNESCTEFQSASTQPSCSSSGRGTALDPQPFLRQ